MKIEVKAKKDVAIVEMSLFELRVMSSIVKKKKFVDSFLGISKCSTPGCKCFEVGSHILEVLIEADQYLEDLRDNPMEDSKPW